MYDVTIRVKNNNNKVAISRRTNKQGAGPLKAPGDFKALLKVEPAKVLIVLSVSATIEVGRQLELICI